MTVHDEARASFEQQLRDLRPKLHRYCARMAGSVVDGEDIVQEALIKAIKAFGGEAIDNVQSWLFRIAHNAALDFLRARRRQEAGRSEEDADMIVDETASAAERYAASASLRTFMRLPTAQRGTVILMDVLGYSLREVSDITGMTIAAIKAALHRGRGRLRELADSPEDAIVPSLSGTELARLANYAERFNAHDFDAVRNMLADDVKLELVSRARMEGRKRVSHYFGNYASVHDWTLTPGLVDGRPALLVSNPATPDAPPTYFVIVEWDGDKVAQIRDFRHVPYVAECAQMIAATPQLQEPHHESS
ncbi:MAG: polymerase sigma70 [Nevskia sp.]|nr:polymerase sigma70 [Nevskia sp.]